MVVLVESFLILFLALTVIAFLPRRIGVPLIVIEILIGMVLGKSFLNVIPYGTPVLEFFSSFGLVFVMFLAGLEIDVTTLKSALSRTLVLTMGSILIPFGIGMLIGEYLLGVHPLLVGTIFSTTSLGLVLPLLEELDYRRDYLQLLLSSVAIVDIISMFLLAFTFSYLGGDLNASFIYSAIALFTLLLLPLILRRPEVKKRIESFLSTPSVFRKEIRFCFALIFLFVAVIESIGFHSIVGSFIAGLIIAETTPQHLKIIENMKTFGYGFFIPLFFVLIGTKVDVTLLLDNLENVGILLAMIIAAVVGKVVGVFASMRLLLRFPARESIAMGLFHASKLSLVIAAIEVGRRAGYINLEMFSFFVVMAVVSAIIGPSIGKMVLMKKTDFSEGGSSHKRAG